MAKKKLLFFVMLLFGLMSGAIAIETVTADAAEKPNFYVFVTFGMPNLKALVADAKKYNAMLVIQGLKDDSFMKTANHLKEILKEEWTGILIDPTLFRKYQVKKVPTFVIATDDSYDKLSGNVTIQYALNKIISDGEWGNLAKELLK